ncbi:hypothetical protein SAMN02910357_01665 [Succinivibrio dextrinosolvens]|uniref:LolA family protein n=1 Tax=Succinivibrio dextrinosolvens TaxID=83771 RepID=UPI0008EEFF94|nr:hypothetical protein [Succinivibrio dextrinosolvens]SFS75547.1 hypothetical protein SAMN02910357_01665 [Succinivibrio dextrinosolvens]
MPRKIIFRKTMFTYLKRTALFLLTAFSVTLSAQALTLNEIGDKLQGKGSHALVFTQDKYLKDANLNLQSSGSIVNIKDKGVLIKQAEPYPMVLAIKKDSITEYSAGEVHTIKADDNPAVHSLLNLMLKLMNPDDSLTKAFDCKLSGTKEHYTAKLGTKDEILKKFFETITLEGTEYIDSLEIMGSNGDITTMKFSDYDFSSKAVTDEDLKYFE